VNIRLNGTPRALKPGQTLRELLEELGLHRDGIAVAINLQVLPRSQYAERALREGDAVEVIQAVGGG
jgi:sulfur carrier protein